MQKKLKAETDLDIPHQRGEGVHVGLELGEQVLAVAQGVGARLAVREPVLGVLASALEKRLDRIAWENAVEHGDLRLVKAPAELACMASD